MNISAEYRAELLGGLESAKAIVNKHASGDHAAMVIMRLEQASELLTALTAANAGLKAEVERLKKPVPEKMAPVQGFPQGIPWPMHLRAYAAYCKKWSPQPALIEGWCRGGFGDTELDMLIPGWREELDDRTATKKEMETLRAQLATATRERDSARSQADALQDRLNGMAASFEKMAASDRIGATELERATWREFAAEARNGDAAQQPGRAEGV